jgi:hypothetical protein
MSVTKCNNFLSTYKDIVGNPETLNSVATDVNLVQSTLATLIFVLCKDWATWFQIGSKRLQWAHHGA